MLRVVLGRAWTQATRNLSVEGEMEFGHNPDSTDMKHSVMVISRDAASSDTAVTSSIMSTRML